MSLVPKRFCFCCKKASEELEAENKTLKFCNDCQIAQYCSRECQLIDFKNCHKQVCAKMLKPAKVKQAEVELGLKVKGFDVNKSKLNSIDSRSTQSTKNPELPEAPPITIAILPNFDKLQSGSLCVMRDFVSNLSFYTVCQMV